MSLTARDEDATALGLQVRCVGVIVILFLFPFARLCWGKKFVRLALAHLTVAMPGRPADDWRRGVDFFTGR